MSLPLYNVHHRNHPLALPSVDTLTSSRSVSVEIGSFASVPFTPSGLVAPEIASVASVLSFASSQSVPSDIVSQRVPVQIYEGHEDRVYCVSFFPDENKLVSGSHNGSLHICNRKTGAVNVLSGHTRMVVDVDVSPGGKMVVSGSGDRTVRIWNRESGEMIQNLEGHKNLVISVQFSPDSSRVVSGSDDGTVRVWSVETGELAFESMECYGLVLCVRYSPSGDRIASGANSIQIWDAQTGNGILSIRNSKVTSLVWTVDGTHIIGDHGGNVTIWNSHNGEPLRTWKVHDDTTNIIVTTLSLSPCGAHLASSNWGKNTTFVYDISTGEQVAAFEHGQTSKGIAYPPSGKFIAMGCEDTKVYVWEVPSFEDPQTKPQKSSASSLDSLFLDRPAIPLAGLSRNNEIDQFWDSQPDIPHLGTYRNQQPSFHPQRIFNRVRNKFTNLFTGRPAGATQTSCVRKTVESADVAAGRDKVFWIIILPIIWTPVKRLIYMLFFCRKPEEEVEVPTNTAANSSQATAGGAVTSEQSERPETVEGGRNAAGGRGNSSSTPASSSVIRTQPECTSPMGLSSIPAGPESIEMDIIPQNPIVPANTSPQPMSSTDPLSPAVASCKPSSSTSTMTSVPLSVPLNSTRPVFAQLPSNNTDVPIAVIVSLEELAILQELRRHQATSSLVGMVAEPLNGPSQDREPYVHQSPSTLSHQFPPSITQCTSSTPLPACPQARSQTHAAAFPVLDVGPALMSPWLLSMPSRHSTHQPPTMAKVQPLGLTTVSTDDTPVEIPLMSAAQPTAVQSTNTDEGRAFYEGMHGIEYEIPYYGA